MSTAEIKNFIALGDRFGLGGQPTDVQFREVRDDGYHVVVNLAPIANGQTDERPLVEALGLKYYHVPVDWTDPTDIDFQRFCDVLDGLAEDQKVLLHCAANFRVTAFFSSYAMARFGWTSDQADALIGRVWASHPTYRMDDVWEAFIDRTRVRARAIASGELD